MLVVRAQVFAPDRSRKTDGGVPVKTVPRYVDVGGLSLFVGAHSGVCSWCPLASSASNGADQLQSEQNASAHQFETTGAA